MASTYHIIPPITHQRDLYLQPITALCFDPVSDTLWSGNNSGIVAAYYSARGMRGVSYRVGGNLAVKGIIAGDSLVRGFGISSGGIGAWTKGGVNKWFYRTPTAVTAFSNNSTTGSVFFACTAAQELLAINSQTGDLVRRSSIPSIYTHLVNATNTLLTGASDGYVRTHDPRTSISTVNTVRAHTNGIQGLLATGTFVYTIGLGIRQGHPFPDPLVKVYDTRTLRSLPPVPFSAGPGFIELLPKRSATIVITSAGGLVNVVDVSNVANSEFYQLDMPSYVTSTSVSPSGTYMAFGDADGAISLLTAADEGAILPFNGFEGQPIEWADPPDPPLEFEWTDSTPLSIVGMPYYDSQLLSSWTPKFLPPPSNLSSPIPPRIPSQILSTMKVNDNVAYASLPKELKGRRNVTASQPRSKGRFRSGRSRGEVEPETPTYEYDPEEIPKIYRKVEIEYSKFGVEDFDFGFFNQTSYSGLETHITNSYTNPLIQVLYYTLPIRTLAKSHNATDCLREHCLFCELGFLARMLDDGHDARGVNLQPTNFCKTVSVLAHTHNLIELMDYGVESPDHHYGHMIQAFHRFLLDTLSSESNIYPHNPWLLPQSDFGSKEPSAMPRLAPSPITQLCGVDAKNIITCTSCGAVREKDNLVHVIDMVYPKKAPVNDPAHQSDFASIVRSSLLRHTTHKATCASCSKQFTAFEGRRSIATKDLPPILTLNASVFTEENLHYWKDSRLRGQQGPSQIQQFLPENFELRGQVNGVDDSETATYKFRGMVLRVVRQDERSHLVAIVRMPEEDLYGPSFYDARPWIVFNDFTISYIRQEEALGFAGNWKVPTVLYFEREDACSRLDYGTLPMEIDPSILCQDTNVAVNRDISQVKHQNLSLEELPTPGTLVAIDAEFVSMQQEETEFRSDGTKKVIRPARLSLARVSVLRGSGPKEGVPFIDEHIHTSELIVDYLTEFSGVKFGDLDPQLSRYTLTPLKVAYKKLRVLVDRGCIFVGHGLSKDFRIINIFVPPERVMDTVDLYFIRNRQRRLSLRFLAWYVLKENIQTDTHDSIEDALTALRLYNAFLEYEHEDLFDEKLEELYKEGKQYNFKPPPPPDQIHGQGSTASPGSGVLTPHTGMLTTPQFPMMQPAFMQGQFNPMSIVAGMQPHPSFFTGPPQRGSGSGSFGQHSGSWRR